MKNQQQSHTDKAPFQIDSFIKGQTSPQDNQNHIFEEKPFENVGYKLFSAFATVLISEYLISNTLIYGIMNKVTVKNIKDEAARKVWVDQQLNRLTRTMIRYNSVVFGSKVLLDQYYAENIRRNQAYYQSNSALHYKIGAMVGIIAFSLNIPISQFQLIRSSKSMLNFAGNERSGIYRFEKIASTFKQFLSAQSLKRMLNSFSTVSLAGVIVYRTIYFGGYEKLKKKYNNPVNEYVIAPVICSTLSLIVSPLDQIKFMQMTSHKGLSFFDILNEKGLKLFSLSTEKVFSSIVKQSFSMTTYVLGQKLCTYLLKKKSSSVSY